MIALWMAYGLAVSALLAVAAWGAERCLRLHRRPARFVWAAALLGSLALPAWAALRPAPAAVATREAAAFVAVETGSRTSVLDALATLGALDTFRRPPALLRRSGPALVGLWGASSLLAFLLLAVSLRRVARMRRRWPTAWVAGDRVRVSDAFGPAVVGVGRPEIVLPKWVLALEDRALRMILRHEQEHRDARDTLLMGAGLVAVALAPWNVPLWWQFRRLRMAVELDCDLRVLARGVSRRSYGALLLEVGGRMGGVGPLAAALSEPRSFLERRMRMITEGTPRARGIRTAGAALVAAALLVAACETPAPTQVEGAAPVEAAEARAPAGRYRFEARAQEIGEIAGGIAGMEGEPLLVVDGVIVPSLDGLGPAEWLRERLSLDQIERIEVLKAQAAARLYGERGARGVVQVTTKEAAAREGEAAGELRPRGGTAVLRERALVEREAAAAGQKLEAGTVRLVGGAPKVPLFVDGERWSGTLEELGALDVVSVEVVKGPAAVRELGPEGADGLIRVTTRSGGGSL